jgi:mannose-6-phosphate isomerase-like protein (cupin superfamily)
MPCVFRFACALVALGLSWTGPMTAVPSHASSQGRLLVHAPEGRRLALVIGNDAYPRASLVNSVNDARAMARVLHDVGFIVTEAVNVGGEAMERAVDDFIGRVDSGDIALFYYSGHGAQVSGENYLVPVDYQGADEVALKRRSMALTDVDERLQQRGARVRIHIIDACRDNPYRGTRSGHKGLAAVQAQGALVAFATAPGTTASDNAKGANGLFTEHLLAALRVPGLGASELFRRVRQGVLQASDGKQFPWLSDGLVGEFVFRAAPTPPPTAAGTTDLVRREEVAFWESIAKSTDPGLFEEYLKRYGEAAAFASIARARVRDLRRIAVPAGTGVPAAAPMGPPSEVVFSDIPDYLTRNASPATVRADLLGCTPDAQLTLLASPKPVATHEHLMGAEVLYVIGGHGRVALDGRETAVKPGMVMTVPAGMKHSFRPAGSGRLFMLSIKSGESCGGASIAGSYYSMSERSPSAAVTDVAEFVESNLRRDGEGQESPIACVDAVATRLLQIPRSRVEHAHPGFTEVLYVVGGEGVMRLRGAETQLAPGMTAIVPRGVPHELSSAPRRPLILLSVRGGETCQSAIAE